MIIVLIALNLLMKSKCSLVIDKFSQEGIHISDYCPKMPYCPEGAHVMCMYYNPKTVMGPRCNNPKNISITPELASKLLDVSNAVRSKVAQGKEKGKGGNYLPKGYGMFRLKWDSELATFAQVLANQCVLRHDLCRASKKFADPGQTAGLVRFTYPDWLPVTKGSHFTKPGLTLSKMVYATTQTLKSWYGQKASVTPDMILTYPDWLLNPDSQGGRLYLEMIYGPATHMGCGVSAYTEYAYHDNNAALNYNSIQVICNYSARPRANGPVYNTTPPTEVGYTVRCGCPVGSDEDEDCLCYDSPRKAVTSAPKEVLKSSCTDREMNCKPSVVLLPIFTVEDAPPDKLVSKEGYKNETLPEENSMEIFNAYETPKRNGFQKSINYYSIPSAHIEPQPRNELQILREHHEEYERPSTRQRQILDVKKRYFGRKSITPEHGYRSGPSPRQAHSHVQQNKKPAFTNRQSIFLRAERFQLPLRKYNFNPHGTTMDEKGKVSKKVVAIKKDVIPRKDFSNAQKLVSTYLNKRRNRVDVPRDMFQIKNKYENRLNEVVTEHQFMNRQHLVTTEVYQNSTETTIIDYNRYLKQKFRFNDFNLTSKDAINNHEIKNSNEETDNKLMNLLNTLEQEVKHIELNGNEKEIFDAKIRKIYGDVVGKSRNLMKLKEANVPKTKIHILESDMVKTNDNNIVTNDLRSNLDNVNSQLLDKRTFDTEERIKKLNPKMYDGYAESGDRKPMARNQNSLTQYGNKNDDRKETVKEYRTINKENYNKEDVKDDNNIRGNNDNLNKINNRNVYREQNFLRTRSNGDYDKIRNKYSYRNNDIDEVVKKGNYYLSNDAAEGDPLSVDRRRYYQEKLDNIQRKLHSTRSYRRRDEHERSRQLRPVRPSDRDEPQMRRGSKSQMSPFYMPDRARFLHGF